MNRALLSLVVLAALLASCSMYTRTVYHPVLKTLAEVKSEIGVLPAPATGGTNGKIVLTPDRQTLLVNKLGQGWTVVDASAPATPTVKGFLSVPGSQDGILLQDKDGQLWLVTDSFADLVFFRLDLTPALALTEAARVTGQFPWNGNQVMTDGGIAWVYFDTPVPAGSVAVGYTTTTEIEWSMSPLVYAVDSPTKGGGAETGAVGATGSLARFAYLDTRDPAAPDPAKHAFLYTVDQSSLGIVMVDDLSRPVSGSSTPIGWSIETLFAYENAAGEHFLYVGSSSAMFVYGLATPDQPVKLSTNTHFTARDPVVVGPVGPAQKDTAFVTVSTGLGGEGNLVYAYDVSDPAAPVDLLPTGFALNGPRGLGFLNEGRLLVCEGDKGLRVLDVSKIYDPGHPVANLYGVAVQDGFDFQDVIPGPTNQILVGPTGLRFYAYAETLDGNNQPVPQLTKLGELLF